MLFGLEKVARIYPKCQMHPNATHSTLLYWNIGTLSEPWVLVASDSQVSLLDVIGAEFERTAFVQVLDNSDSPSGLCDSIDAVAGDQGEDSNSHDIIEDINAERLSTIPEGSNEGQDSETAEADFVSFASALFQHQVTRKSRMLSENCGRCTKTGYNNQKTKNQSN